MVIPHDLVRSILIGWPAVTELVGRNPRFENAADAYAIRPGQLDQDDPSSTAPCVIIAFPEIEHDNDLSALWPRSVGTLHVRCVSPVCLTAWAMRDACVYGGESPNDPARTKGLAGLRNQSNASFRFDSIVLTDDRERWFELDDGQDQLIWVVETEFEVSFQRIG